MVCVGGRVSFAERLITIHSNWPKWLICTDITPTGVKQSDIQNKHRGVYIYIYIYIHIYVYIYMAMIFWEISNCYKLYTFHKDMCNKMNGLGYTKLNLLLYPIPDQFINTCECVETISRRFRQIITLHLSQIWIARGSARGNPNTNQVHL